MNHSTKSFAFCALLTVLAVSALALPAGCGQGSGTVRPQALKPREAGRGHRFDSNGWIFVHIEGEPRERGFQHGRLVARELAQIREMLRGTLLDDTGQDYDFFVKAATDLYVPNAPVEFLEEIKGIAEGATSAGTEMTWQEVLAWNANTEVTEYWYPDMLAGDYPDVVDQTHCSAFTATGSFTEGGKVVMAHNTWDHYVKGQYANVILDIKPSRGHAIIMQTMPGLIASMTDYFVTDAGLMGTETTIGDFSPYDPNGTAEFYRARKAMQYASTLDEWVGIMMDGNNGGYANSWQLADARTGEIMLFELGLKYHSVKRTRDGYFIGFNSAIDPKIRNLECGGDPSYYDVRTPMGARRVRLTRLMLDYKGKVDTEVAKTILSDHYDVYLDKGNAPCSRTVEARYDLDPMYYWPARKPFSPQGCVDGKVMDSDMAKEMSFVARWGSSSGMAFDAHAFLDEHPQYGYIKKLLKDRPTEPWTQFSSGQK